LETRQDPLKFFKAIKNCNRPDITLSIVGRPNELVEKYVKSIAVPNIEFLGWRSRDEALRLQRSARMLLVYGHSGGQQIPTKIYEYFGACRPILGVAPDDGDLTARLVLRHNRGIVVPNSHDQIRDALSHLAAMQANGSLEDAFNLTELPEYTPAQTGQQLMRAVLGESPDLEIAPTPDDFSARMRQDLEA